MCSLLLYNTGFFESLIVEPLSESVVVGSCCGKWIFASMFFNQMAWVTQTKVKEGSFTWSINRDIIVVVVGGGRMAGGLIGKGGIMIIVPYRRRWIPWEFKYWWYHHWEIFMLQIRIIKIDGIFWEKEIYEYLKALANALHSLLS